MLGILAVIFAYVKLFCVLSKYWFYDLIDFFREPLLKDLSSETVLITGAASGLGKGVAERLAQLGCTLVLWDVDGAGIARVAEELNTATKSRRIHAMKCDLTSRDNIYDCARKVQETIGNVTMVINNAGVVSGKLLLQCSDASIQRTFDVNIIAHFWVLKAFLPYMMDNNYGHIVTIASSAGFTGAPGLVDYCSSKFAAVGLHDALTHELHMLKKTGIKTTVVCPTFINTGMFEGVTTNVLFPMLQSENVCDLIVDAIRKEEHVLVIPKVVNLGIFIKSIISTRAQIAALGSTGVDHSMDKFVGRR